MTDQTIPADQVRKIATAMRAAMRRDEHAYPEAKFLADLSGYIKDLEAMLPQRPTLADMTEEERRACKWAQADVEGEETRAVILIPNASGERAILTDQGGSVIYEDHADVTPRPDLPRMTWPGDQEPAPAPALPDGCRLADHKGNGRVIVTKTVPNASGNVYFVLPDDGDYMGYGCHWCDPDALTYLAQGADTSDAVPESTLAMGSEWHDRDALTRACEESGRDQIVVLDRAGDAFVWMEAAEWWKGNGPLPGSAPFTIIHPGKKADQ